MTEIKRLQPQLVIRIGLGLLARVVRRKDIARAVIGVAGDMAFRVRDGLQPPFGGVRVFDRVAERIRLAREIAEGVVGVAGHMAEGVGHFGKIVCRVVLIARGVAQRVGDGGHAANRVIFVVGCIALRVGLIQEIAHKVIARRQRRAVGIADLLEQAVHGVGVVCRVAEGIDCFDRIAEGVILDLRARAVRRDGGGRSRR